MSKDNPSQTTKFSLTDAFVNGAKPVTKIVTTSYKIDPAFVENLRATLHAVHQSENLEAQAAARKALKEYIDRDDGGDAILLLRALLHNPTGQSQENKENKDLAVLFLSAPYAVSGLARNGKAEDVWAFITALKNPADQMKILSAPGAVDGLAYNGKAEARGLLETAQRAVAAQAPHPAPGLSNDL